MNGLYERATKYRKSKAAKKLTHPSPSVYKKTNQTQSRFQTPQCIQNQLDIKMTPYRQCMQNQSDSMLVPDPQCIQNQSNIKLIPDPQCMQNQSDPRPVPDH